MADEKWTSPFWLLKISIAILGFKASVLLGALSYFCSKNHPCLVAMCCSKEFPIHFCSVPSLWCGPRPRHVDAIGAIGSRTREFRNVWPPADVGDPAHQTPVAVAVSGCSSPQLTWENYENYDQDWWSNLIYPIGSIYIYIYMVTFTINIPQMLAYIPYMDPMGMLIPSILLLVTQTALAILGPLTWISDQRPYSARMMAWLSGCVENTKTFSSPELTDADSWPPQGGQSWWS